MRLGTESRRFKSPPAKLIRFFERSRDAWKEKYRQLKQECRRLAGQTAAVEESRDRWRREARQLRQTVKTLENELERQKQILEPTAIPS
jgi:chromosome segregation ATPase